ncbi:MAG: arsenosugar biosynthesis radical SAM protein ArsS [Candidatus Latescibacteria bacterium]|nr:arsenosugar biosynthesis radical SAM protein ArsS [Candidatus Latescibacterota bacterium]
MPEAQHSTQTAALLKLIPTLQRRTHALASTNYQRELLASLPQPRFAERLAAAGLPALRAGQVEVLQLNVGKRCNQTCRHCHVDAGPERREVMGDEVFEACLDLLQRSRIPTVDITGGAPELHPRFRELVVRARALGRKVMDRCNLTITQLPNYADLPEFLAAHQVEVVASLPFYAAQATDAQRGEGVFAQSIAALRRFNEVGYGIEGSGLVLNLVTNPSGAFLPGNQTSLEREWKAQLRRRYGVEFNQLYALTNMPISRFLEFLLASGNLDGYLERLVNAFNPATVDGLMCRYTLSVGWDGRLYDCDFNQMLDLALPQTIAEVEVEHLDQRLIQVDQHCFGCTAGTGSSCGGATT